MELIRIIWKNNMKDFILKDVENIEIVKRKFGNKCFYIRIKPIVNFLNDRKSLKEITLKLNSNEYVTKIILDFLIDIELIKMKNKKYIVVPNFLENKYYKKISLVLKYHYHYENGN